MFCRVMQNPARGMRPQRTGTCMYPVHAPRLFKHPCRPSRTHDQCHHTQAQGTHTQESACHSIRSDNGREVVNSGDVFKAFVMYLPHALGRTWAGNPVILQTKARRVIKDLQKSHGFQNIIAIFAPNAYNLNNKLI